MCDTDPHKFYHTPTSPSLTPLSMPSFPFHQGRPTTAKRAETEPVLILYTSGSTGPPKGAVVTGAAFLAEVRPFVSARRDYDGSGVGLIDSPLSVSATPYNMCLEMLNGGRVAVYKTLTRVFDVARVVSPDSLGLVPQLWAVLYKQYHEELTSRIEAARCSATPNGSSDAGAALDAEYRTRLGFRIRGLNCGGATPMPQVQA